MRALVGVVCIVAACGDTKGAPTDASMIGDGADGGDAGTIDAAIDDAMPSPDAAPAQCGDGVRVRGEECDDDGTANGDGCDATCKIEPPVGASAPVIAALHAINALRAQADEAGVPMNLQVIQAAQAHATYYATNAAAYAGTLSPHDEDPAFPTGFTGAHFNDRMSAAGYTGPAFFEGMAFAGNATAAVAQWLNSVFHRVPLLHPNMTKFGYGIATGSRAADVCDFSSGPPELASRVIVWPPPDATGVPRQFNRLQEGPNPPAPPGGGNITGPVISVFFANGSNATITSHVVKNSAGAVVAHTFLTPTTPTFGPFLSGSYALYGDGPAAAGAKFTVEIVGTVGGQAFTKTWSFTTQ